MTCRLRDALSLPFSIRDRGAIPGCHIHRDLNMQGEPLYPHTALPGLFPYCSTPPITAGASVTVGSEPMAGSVKSVMSGNVYDVSVRPEH